MKTPLSNPVIGQGLIDLSKVSLAPDRPHTVPVAEVRAIKVQSSLQLPGIDLPEQISLTIAPQGLRSSAQLFSLRIMRSAAEILAGKPPCYRVETDRNFAGTLALNMDLVFHGTLFDFKVTNAPHKAPNEPVALLGSFLAQLAGKPWTKAHLESLQPVPPSAAPAAKPLSPFQSACAQIEQHLSKARETVRTAGRLKNAMNDALAQQAKILGQAVILLERLPGRDLTETESFERRKLAGRVLFAQAYNKLRGALRIDFHKRPLPEVEESFGAAIARFGEAQEFSTELKNEAEIKSGLTQAHLSLSKIYIKSAKAAHGGGELRNQLYSQAFFHFLTGEGAVTRACELMAHRRGDETQRLRSELKAIGHELSKLQLSPARRSEYLVTRALYYLWHGRFANSGEFVRVLMHNRDVPGVQRVLYKIAEQPYSANSHMKALVAADRLVRLAGGADFAEVVAFNSAWRATSEADFKGRAEIDVMLRIKRPDNKLELEPLLYPVEVKHTLNCTSVREWRNSIDEQKLLDQLQRQALLCDNLRLTGYPMGKALFVLIGPRLQDQLRFLPAFVPHTSGLCLRINHNADSSVQVPFPAAEQVQKWLRQTDNLKLILQALYPEISGGSVSAAANT